MYYFKENYFEISKSLNKNGLSVVRSLIKKKDINNIKSKAKKLLSRPKYLGPAFNVKLISQNTKMKSKLKGVTRELNYKLSKNILNKGYKYYSKFTNSIEILNPLLNFPELNDYIFQDDIIAVAKEYLKTEDPKVLYVAMRIHFRNNIPENDFNFFHCDDRSFVTNNKNHLLKLLIPFHLKKGNKIEFNQLTIPKNKMNISKKLFQSLQYSKKKDFPKRLKKFFIKPNIKNQDAYFFNPDNFFHNAEKPKTLRIMVYIVFGKNTSYLAKKSHLIKINKKYFDHLPLELKNFGSLLNKHLPR
jgi:hypothetical protein